MAGKHTNALIDRAAQQMCADGRRALLALYIRLELMNEMQGQPGYLDNVAYIHLKANISDTEAALIARLSDRTIHPGCHDPAGLMSEKDAIAYVEAMKLAVLTEATTAVTAMDAQAKADVLNSPIPPAYGEITTGPSFYGGRQ